MFKQFGDLNNLEVKDGCNYRVTIKFVNGTDYKCFIKTQNHYNYFINVLEGDYNFVLLPDLIVNKNNICYLKIEEVKGEVE